MPVAFVELVSTWSRSIKIGAQHEVLNVLGFLDFPGAVLSGASLFGGLFENPCRNKRQ